MDVLIQLVEGLQHLCQNTGPAKEVVMQESLGSMTDEGEENQGALLDEGIHVLHNVWVEFEDIGHSDLLLPEQNQILGELVEGGHEDVDETVKVGGRVLHLGNVAKLPLARASANAATQPIRIIARSSISA